MALRLTGYGGVGEIGGSAFLLEAGRTRVLLDVGKRFGHDQGVEAHGHRPGWGDYFDEYLQPRTFRYVPDLLALGLIPPVAGLYRQDLGGVATAGRPGEGALDAVLVSHAHMDHVGLLGLVRPDIPVATSAESRAVLASMQETGMARPENDFVGTKAKGRVGRNQDGSLSGRPRFAQGPERRFEAPRDVGELRVEALRVDHSIPGAQAFLLESADGSVAYTGDYRLHGRNAAWSEAMVKRAGGVDVLLTEGTNVAAPGAHAHRKQTDDELSVEGAVADAVAREDARAGTTGFVGIAYPPRDLDRLMSLLAVASKTGRRLAISPKQAHLLDSLRAAGRDELPDPRADARIAIYFEASNKGLLLEHPDSVPVAAADLSVRPVAVGEAEFAQLVAADYAPWAREYLESRNRVGPLDVRHELGAFLFSVGYFSITELFDVFPDRAAAGGLYIHSQTQPFNDDMLQDQRKLARWLKAYRLGRVDTHVSGHLGEATLEWVLDEIRARMLIPVHTEAAGVTGDRYHARTGMAATQLEWGKPVQLG